MDQFDQYIEPATWVALILLIVLLASFMLSFLEKPSVLVLGHIRTICNRAGKHWAENGAAIWDRFATHWIHRQNEFTHPVLLELSRLRKASIIFGRPAFESLRARVDAFGERLKVLERFGSFETGEGNLHEVNTEVVMLWVVFGMAIFGLLAMSGANFWLLRMFFQQVTDEPLTFLGPLRFVSTADVVAILFPLVEGAAGAMLHFLQPKGGRFTSTAHQFFGSMAPWSILAALGLVEVFAYAELSLRFGLEKQFALAENSPFYLVAKYFMAPFGAALTVGIAGLSYYVIESYRNTAGSRTLKKFERQLASARDAMRALREGADNLVPNTCEALEEAEAIIDKKLKLADSTSMQGSTLGERIAFYVKELQEPSASSVPRSNTVGLFCFYLVIGATWILLLFLNAIHFEKIAEPLDSNWAQTFLGFSMAGLIAVLGTSLGQHDYGRRDSQQSVMEGHGVPRWLLIGAAAIIVSLSVSLSVVYESVGQLLIPNLLHGLVLSLGLMFTSSYLSIVFQAMVTFILLVGTLIWGAVHWIATIAATLTELCIWLVMSTLRLVCIPGRAIRRKGMQ